MKKPLDFLNCDKEPFMYLERCKIRVNKGQLLIINKDDLEKTVPPGMFVMLYLGPGTSISHEAARLCAEYDCNIGFVRGGFNVHSYWHCGRYSTPEKLVKQCYLHSNKKLEVAKYLLSLRFYEDKEVLEKIEKAPDVGHLLSIEAHTHKAVYRSLAKKTGAVFVRDKKSQSDSNGKLTILNNLMYNFCTSIILSYGFHPSVGFIHGTTRRGGMAFDLADLYKIPLTITPSFEDSELDNKVLMHDLSSKLKKNRGTIIKNMYLVLESIYKEDFNVSNNIKLIKT